jgi:hypothetical protein
MLIKNSAQRANGLTFATKHEEFCVVRGLLFLCAGNAKRAESNSGSRRTTPGRALTMLAVVQKIVQCAVVLYLVTHGLPVVSAAELRGLASAVLAQFRITI